MYILPVELLLDILEYPTTKEVVETLLQNEAYAPLVREGVKYLSGKKGEEISSSLLLELSKLRTVDGYIVRVEHLDHLIDLSKNPWLKRASFDLSYLRPGYELREDRYTLDKFLGKYITTPESFQELVMGAPPLKELYWSPKAVNYLVSYFTSFGRDILREKEDYSFTFLEDVSTPLLRLEKDKLITLREVSSYELGNTLHSMIPETYIGYIQNDGIAYELVKIIPQLREVRVHLEDFQYNYYPIETLLRFGLERFSLVDTTTLTENNLKRILVPIYSLGATFSNTKAFLPLTREFLEETQAAFPNLEEIAYLHIPGEEIPWNTLMRYPKIIIYSQEEIEVPSILEGRVALQVINPGTHN